MSIQGSSPDEIGALRGFPLKVHKLKTSNNKGVTK
jgi:hypothetical protein